MPEPRSSAILQIWKVFTDLVCSTLSANRGLCEASCAHLSRSARLLTMGEALCHAARTGRMTEVRRMLGEMDLRQMQAPRPLHITVHSGNTGMARVFLAAGADVNSTLDGHTALHSAVARGNMPMARLLIEHGADVDGLSRPIPRTPSRCTLPFACRGCSVMVQPSPSRSETPVNLAVQRGNRLMMLILADAGADLAARDEDGQTLDELASKRGQKTLAEMIRETRDAKARARALERHTALAMGMHARLGAGSILCALPDDVLTLLAAAQAAGA